MGFNPFQYFFNLTRSSTEFGQGSQSNRNGGRSNRRADRDGPLVTLMKMHDDLDDGNKRMRRQEIYREHGSYAAARRHRYMMRKNYNWGIKGKNGH